MRDMREIYLVELELFGYKRAVGCRKKNFHYIIVFLISEITNCSCIKKIRVGHRTNFRDIRSPDKLNKLYIRFPLARISVAGHAF